MFNRFLPASPGRAAGGGQPVPARRSQTTGGRPAWVIRQAVRSDIRRRPPASIRQPSANPASQARLGSTGRYLQQAQSLDGGFGGASGKESGQSCSAWVALALAAAGINPKCQQRPGGVVRLAGRDDFRIRVGDYRIVYAVDDAERLVVVARIARRREVYRR